MPRWFVYVLKSLVKTWFYIGSTDDLTKRLSDHNLGHSCRVCRSKDGNKGERIREVFQDWIRESNSSKKNINRRSPLKADVVGLSLSAIMWCGERQVGTKPV